MTAVMEKEIIKSILDDKEFSEETKLNAIKLIVSLEEVYKVCDLIKNHQPMSFRVNLSNELPPKSISDSIKGLRHSRSSKAVDGSQYVEQYRSIGSNNPNLVNEKDQLFKFLLEPNHGFALTRMELKEYNEVPTVTKQYVFLTNKPLIAELIQMLHNL